MSPKPAIRPATRADLDVLVEFNAALAFETEGKHLDRAVLERGVAGVFEDPRRGFYLLAEDPPSVLGGLLVTYEWSDWRAGDWFWLQSVYVRPEARGRGVFRALLAAVEARALGAGAVGLRLYVERANLPAQQRYRRLGFVETHYHLYEKAV